MNTPGIVCLQGGNELTRDCRPMDEHLLTYAVAGPVVVVPLAAEAGTDYRRTGEHATTYLRGLGADVVVAPDARKAPAEAAEAVQSAGLVVLPGGSPRRLRDALVESGVAGVIRERHAAGVPVMGSSAGAMVACSATLLPQWRGNPNSGPGIGLVDGYVVVPHFDGRRGGWVAEGLQAAPKVLGIPECSGVVVHGDGALTAVGVAASTLITADGRESLPTIART